MVKCQRCNREFYDFDVEKYWYLDACLHLFCKGCLIKQINQDYVNNNGEVKCLDNTCQSLLTQYDYANLVDKERFQNWNEKIVEKNYNIIQCSKCPYKFQFASGQVDLNIKGPQGKPLPKYLAQHYAENRFTCPECKTEQCKGCKVSPYHIGFTCEEWIKNLNAKHCRYCESVIQKPNASAPQALQDICSQEECQQKAKMACQKILPCSHPCSGCLNEVKCLDCLHDSCAENNPALLGQKGSDYCNICFIEGLIQAPSIQLKSCGHIFHFHCILKRLEIRWHRPRITFNFCLCPLCKKWMEFPAESPLQLKMQENMALFEKIKTMSLQRLKHEDRDKDERLKKVGDPYYNKPMEYAIAIYSYYMCFKCKNPYFGGLKSCENMMEEEKGLIISQLFHSFPQYFILGKEGFDPKELVCANCCEVAPIENCPKHGKDFIEFKCKFCCSIAQWFCWGTTHFCDPCHKRQASGDYLTKYSKDKLPKCFTFFYFYELKGPGKAKCPLAIDHKPNGEECALGCSLCRNIKENQKEF